MKQFKYEVLITVAENSTDTQEEMLGYTTNALIQEMGFYCKDIKVNQIGFLVNDNVDDN